MHAADRLDAVIAETGSIACVGLDPRPDLLPPSIIERHRGAGSAAEAVAAAFTEANRLIIDAIAGACAAVKPQAAGGGLDVLRQQAGHATECVLRRWRRGYRRRCGNGV